MVAPPTQQQETSQQRQTPPPEYRVKSVSAADTAPQVAKVPRDVSVIFDKPARTGRIHHYDIGNCKYNKVLAVVYFSRANQKFFWQRLGV